MKFIVSILRIIVGALFIFSGFIKAIDPIGTSYKLEEYFSSEVFDIGFLHDQALPLAVILVIAEIILGLLLLLGIKIKATLWALFGLISFFLFLTFYSAYYDAVKDCGCFGDFIKLSPWESFTKDLVLFVLTLILLIKSNYIQPLFSSQIGLGIAILGLFITIFVVWHGINRLPLIDFRPFAKGLQIQKGLEFVPDNKQYIYRLKNLKGKKDTLVDSNYYVESGIWEDTLTWKYDENYLDSIVIQGTLPKIKSFVISDSNDNVISDKVLEAKKIILIVFPEDTKYCTEGLQKIITLKNQISKEDKSIEFLAIGSQKNIMSTVPSAVLDDAVMKQMIRSNPGILILSKGKVLEKYHYKSLPNSKEISQLFKP